MLEKKLCNLKSNYVQNFEEITRTEITLNNVIEQKIRSDLENHKTFELLNAEKMTPKIYEYCKRF